MSSNEVTTPRQHASTGSKLPQPPEPTHAERVRTLMSLTSTATLSTVSRKHAGFPFGSLMPFALDAAGRPIFLISSMAMHTQNLMGDPRCSLDATRVPEAEIGSVRETYLARHENSRYWVDFNDFSFFRLQPIDVYYVGGFGVMGWVDAGEYERATPDPLAGAATGILEHMNADHVAAMILLARSHAQLEATEATMTSVDRLGFSLRLKTAAGMKGARINFPREVASAEETRGELVAMVRQARMAK
jgi:putative heme iron utilization protein